MLRRGISFCELLAEFGRRFVGATPHSAEAATRCGVLGGQERLQLRQLGGDGHVIRDCRVGFPLLSVRHHVFTPVAGAGGEFPTPRRHWFGCARNQTPPSASSEVRSVP